MGGRGRGWVVWETVREWVVREGEEMGRGTKGGGVEEGVRVRGRGRWAVGVRV